MIQALTSFISDSGWMAPLYYVASYVVTALLPVVPTPLVAALGGTAFGLAPAVAYGLLGLGLGAAASLTLGRAFGRPLLRRLVPAQRWSAWERLLGIESVAVWGAVFFLLNLDFAVTAAGLSTLPLRRLWLAAVLARAPWLVAAAWFGDAVLVSDAVAWLTLLLLVPGLYLLGRVRPLLQQWLLQLGAPRLARRR